MRRRLQHQRQEEQEAARARYEEALAEHNAHIDSLRTERRNTRSNRQLWTWLTLSLAVRRAQQAPPEQPSITAEATDQEEILSAGARGEQLAASHFAARLQASWTMFCGYRNRGGEIDQLLLGPTGLWAVEVKHRNATVECEGDEWWYQHYDKYGKLMRQGSIVDGGGRSPSQQLNMPGDALEQFLRSRGHAISIRRVVLLTHPNSMVKYCGDLTVDLVTESADEVLDLMSSTPQVLNQVQAEDLETLIVRDHHRHNSRRPRRGSR
jgi:hypothetical protein